LLRPYRDDEMQAYPISPLVNRPANDGPRLIEPAA
jgi:putative SOS response-associated peptidase YedK